MSCKPSSINDLNRGIFRMEINEDYQMRTDAKTTASVRCPDCKSRTQQCNLGHIICRTCKGEIDECPICYEIEQESNDLTEVENSCLYSCTYSVYGCEKTIKRSQIEQHEEFECTYKPYRCPFRFSYMCIDFSGTAKELATHIDTVHISNDIEIPHCTRPIASTSNELSKFAVVCGQSTWMFTRKTVVDGKHFYFCLYQYHTATDSGHFAMVKMIGTEAEAKQYLYKGYLIGATRSLSYEGIVQSMHADSMEVYSQRNCLTYDCVAAMANRKIHKRVNGSYDSESFFGFTVYRR